MLGDTATRTLLAVIAQDRPTVRSVASEVGRSSSATWAQLLKLRRAGLVIWDHGKQSTLRPMVTPIAHVFGYDGAGADPSSGKSSSQPPSTNPWSEESAPMLDATRAPVPVEGGA